MVQEIFESVENWSIPVQSMVAVFSSTALVQDTGTGERGGVQSEITAQQHENVTHHEASSYALIIPTL